MRINKICGERVKKTKRAQSFGYEVAVEGQKNAWAIPNYEPTLVEGEDCTTPHKQEQKLSNVRLFDNVDNF